MKKTLTILILAAMLMSAFAVCSFAATSDAITTAQAPYGTPVIDGEIDAIWANATAYKYGADTKGSALEAGQFKVMWDENYLYFLFEINDSTMMDETAYLADKNWYARDQVALAFNPSGDRTATTAVGKSTDHFWYTYRPYGIVPNFCQAPMATFITETPDANIADSLDFTKHPMNNRMYAYKITGTGYIIEAKVNLSARYTSWKNEAGKTVEFDTFVYGNDYTADNTAAKQDHVFPWADATVTSYKDNSKKGQILLLDKPAETTAAAEVTTAAPEATTAAAEATTAAPATTTAPANPSTGDASSAAVIAVIAVLALAGTAVTVIATKVRD